MQDEVSIVHHRLRHVNIRHIRAYRVAVLIGCPVLWGLSGHPRAILHKRIVDININRCTVALCLPITRYGNLTPLADIVVLAVEVLRSFLWIAGPMEEPLSVEREDFGALLFLRRQL